MAAIDKEEQQGLLEESTQRRRAFSRLAWVATGLSAAVVAAVIWHSSADTSMRSATTPDAFAKSVKLEELTDDESPMPKLTENCTRLLIKVEQTCQLDHMKPKPDFQKVCHDACQFAIMDLDKFCPGAVPSLNAVLAGCAGDCQDALGSIAYALGDEDDPRTRLYNSWKQEDCSLEQKVCQVDRVELDSGTFDPCIAGCQRYMCNILDKCPVASFKMFSGHYVHQGDIHGLRRVLKHKMQSCTCDGWKAVWKAGSTTTTEFAHEHEFLPLPDLPELPDV
jgi:hypothetical protein